MPYKSARDLPTSLQRILPDHAQDIYVEAFNNAYETYKNPSKRDDSSTREETAHRVAWAAVKQKYRKSIDNSWHIRRDD